MLPEINTTNQSKRNQNHNLSSELVVQDPRAKSISVRQSSGTAAKERLAQNHQLVIKNMLRNENIMINQNEDDD